MGVKKYFIAIVIPEPFQTKIEVIKKELYIQHNLKGSLRSPSHITLHRPFEWKEEKETLLIETLKNFQFDATFDIELYGFGAFSPRVIYVNVLFNNLLFKLHEELKKFTSKGLKLFNELDDERGFHPHVTVAFRDLKKPLFYMLQEEFKKKELTANFPYQGFSLLKLEKKWDQIKLFDQLS